MKTVKAVTQQLRRLLELLAETGICIAVNPVIEKHSGNVTRVTWTSPAGANPTLTTFVFATIEEYCAYVDSQMYSALLFDGSILQISYDFEDTDLIGHRLLYYPCPYNADRELLRTESVGDVIDFYRDSQDEKVNLRSPFRFDYDHENSTSGHPSVHMHLISPDCRWPVTMPVSIGHFIGFVFRHFYPELWALHPFLRSWPREVGAHRTITVEEETYLFVSCGR